MANVLLCLFCFLLYITRKEKGEKAARFPEAAVVFEIFINLDLSFADLKHIRWALGAVRCAVSPREGMYLFHGARAFAKGMYI